MAYKVAFKVKHDSGFYEKYFDAKEEKVKFKELALPFFEKHGIDGRFYMTKSLAVKIPKEQREKNAEHLRKNPDGQGFYWFKKKSPIQKEWEETVTAPIDFKRLEQVDLWWLSYIFCGKYSLWDHEGEIYGYLEDSYEKDIKLDDFMEQIKISEYYAAIERYEDGKTENR
jgi:hypothetical protein